MKPLMILTLACAASYGQATERSMVSREIREQGLCVARHETLRSLHIAEAAYMGAAFADVASTQGLYERNPVLGRGQFNWDNQGVKSLAISAGVVVAAELVSRKWPKMRKPLKVVLWIGSAARMAAGVHNWRQHAQP